MSGVNGGDPPEAILVSPKLSPLQILARVALVVILVYLIFGVVIPQFADYDEVWAAITSLTTAGLITMVMLTLAIELGKAAAPALLIDGLGLRPAFLAQESAAVVSNTIPGPSGTISKYATYRRFGIDSVDFARGTALSSAWNNLVALMMPTFAMILLATQDTVPGRVVALTSIALGISIVAIAVAAFIVRSERFALRFGDLAGRILNWARGLVRRAPTETVGEAVVRLRFDVLETVRSKGGRLTLVVVGKELTTALALVVSLRSLDVGRVELTTVEIFASYSLVRLLTIVEITPGNVGIAEALYISTLTWAAPDTNQDVIVAAVFTFRMFTYLGPIVLGAGCWLWLRHAVRRRRAGAATRAEDDP